MKIEQNEANGISNSVAESRMIADRGGHKTISKPGGRGFDSLLMP